MSIMAFNCAEEGRVRSVAGTVPAVGVPCRSREWGVLSSRDKTRIIGQLQRLIGEHGEDHYYLCQRAGLVVDEMLENALYAAPRDSKGRPLFAKGNARTLLPAEAIRLRCSFDGEQLFLEVSDSWGNLSIETVEHFLSLNLSETDPVCDRMGRGLFIMWKFLDYFYVKVTPELNTTIGGVLNLYPVIVE